MQLCGDYFYLQTVYCYYTYAAVSTIYWVLIWMFEELWKIVLVVITKINEIFVDDLKGKLIQSQSAFSDCPWDFSPAIVRAVYSSSPPVWHTRTAMTYIHTLLLLVWWLLLYHEVTNWQLFNDNCACFNMQLWYNNLSDAVMLLPRWAVLYVCIVHRD